jgi:hypothetical protein
MTRPVHIHDVACLRLKLRRGSDHRFIKKNGRSQCHYRACGKPCTPGASSGRQARRDVRLCPVVGVPLTLAIKPQNGPMRHVTAMGRITPGPAGRGHQRYATHVAQLCPVVTGLGRIVDNLADAGDKCDGLWTTCPMMVVNVHPRGVQPVLCPGCGWGLSQVPNERPVEVLTGFRPCPHRILRAMALISGVIHSIHIPYNGNEFYYYK